MWDITSLRKVLSLLEAWHLKNWFIYKGVRITMMKAATAEVPTSRSALKNKKRRALGVENCFIVISSTIQLCCKRWISVLSGALSKLALKSCAAALFEFRGGKYPGNPFNNALDWRTSIQSNRLIIWHARFLKQSNPVDDAVRAARSSLVWSSKRYEIC